MQRSINPAACRAPDPDPTGAGGHRHHGRHHDGLARLGIPGRRHPAGHYFWIFEFFAVGLLGSVTPILSQYLGARRFRMARPTVRKGLWAAIIIAGPSAILLWFAGPVLVFLGQDPDLSGASQSYLRYLIISLLPMLWNIVLNDFLVAHARPLATMVVSVAAIAVNGLADYAFMFGNFGFPAMGLKGAGLDTAVVTTLMFLAILTFMLTDIGGSGATGYGTISGDRTGRDFGRSSRSAFPLP
ncbi:MAG: MATE family efflux transporter [Alphaproteobacteria bacterium]